MLVKELMTKTTSTCGPEEMLVEAAKVMQERDCGFVPVVERAGGRLVGVITDRDVCLAAYGKGLPLWQIPIGSVMTRDVHVCAPEDDLHRAQRIMADNQVRRLPVVDGLGALVGVLSLDDIALESSHHKDPRAREEVAITLGRIGRHHALSSQ